MRETAIKAGAKILEFFGSASILYTKKSAADIVTEADLASNAIICEAIKEQYPDHGILSEEGEGYQEDSDHAWHIDPLDGTKNFQTGTPLFGINMALSYKGEVIHAAIYLPITNDFCYAEKGKGAFLNGSKTQCSSKEEWKGTYGLGPIRPSAEHRALLAGIIELEDKAWVNAIATSAVSGLWVSTGKRDWYVGPGKNAWDYAATSLIAQEAGAMVTNFAGTEYKPGDRGIVVANRFLHPQLIELVKRTYPQS